MNMFNYELLFLIFDFIINEQKKISCGINFNGNESGYYSILVSLYYTNKIYQKNKCIDNLIYNKFVLNLALVNKFSYNIYDTCIIKCYYCKIPLVNNKYLYGTSNYLEKSIKKSCNNQNCKIKEQIKRH